MKKALIYSLSLALLLSLTACHKSEPEQTTEPTTPAATNEPVQEPTTAEPTDTTGQLSNKQLPEISHDELLEVFEEQYAILQSIDNSDSEDAIQNELFTIQFMIEESMEKSLPSDYEQQYRAWRAAYEEDDDDEAARIEAEAKDIINQSKYPEPDQELIDAGFVATRDPSSPTGWSYENPNIVVNEEDRGTIGGADSFFTDLTEDEAHTNTSNPYSGYGEVQIGYGEDTGNNSSGSGNSDGFNNYKPGGSVEIGGN